MTRPVALLVTAVLLATTGTGHLAAQGLFGGGNKLDPSFCKPHLIRQTVVYIDDMTMVDGRTDWAQKLIGKLKATLIPGERVSVVQLSPASGESHEIWSGCWPAYSTEERAKLAGETHLFSRGRLAQVDDQQKFFSRDFGVALTTIYNAGKRPQSATVIDPASPPTKNILRALASDESRYSHSEQTVRAVIYSDMAESSDIGSVFKPQPSQAVSYGTKLGTYLRRSVFYAFGVGEDVRNPASVQDATRAFWTSALRSMASAVAGFGTDLTVPNVVPVAAHVYALDLMMDGQELDGRLTALTDDDGNLVDSLIGISRLSSAVLAGTLRCKGGGEAQTCDLQATAVGGLTTTSSAEAISLSGREDARLDGKIGVKGSAAVFQISAKPAQN